MAELYGAIKARIYPEENLNQVLITFLKNYQSFSQDVRILNYQTLMSNYKDFITDLDSINTLGIPQSIDNALKLLKNPKPQLKKSLENSVAFLYSSIPWESLKNSNNFKKTAFAYEGLIDIWHYTTKTSFTLESDIDSAYRDFVEELRKQVKQLEAEPRKKMPIPTTNLDTLDKVLDTVQRNKMSRTASTIAQNDTTFKENMRAIYKEFLPKKPIPTELSSASKP